MYKLNLLIQEIIPCNYQHDEISTFSPELKCYSCISVTGCVGISTLIPYLARETAIESDQLQIQLQYWEAKDAFPFSALDAALLQWPMSGLSELRFRTDPTKLTQAINAQSITWAFRLRV